MISTVGVGQRRDSTLRFFGNLYDSESFQPVEYAHIINMDGNNATISDTLGTFDLRIEPGDSLMITAIGYGTTYYQYSGDWQKAVFSSIPMEKKAYAISEVEITPWGTYRQFKNKFLELELKDPEEDLHPQAWKDIQREPTVEEQINPGITSPVTMIYALFSEEIQSMEKLKELQIRMDRENKLKEKFNPEQVSELTGLKGDELIQFMNYCNFSEKYILNTKEYFILERVKKCYRQYRRLDSLRQRLK